MASPIAAANAYANLSRIMDGAIGGAGKSAALAADTGAPSFGELLKGAVGVMDGVGSGALGTGNGALGAGTGGPSFGELLKSAVGSVMETGHKSDVQTAKMVAGKANVMDVVTAVAETDVAVSTLVSVRDRVIQAYEDIMKMPI